MKRNITIVCLLVVLLLLVLQVEGYACPNCYGDPESSATEGMNMAIMSLLGVTGGVLVSIAGFFLYLRRRLRLLNQRFVNRLN